MKSKVGIVVLLLCLLFAVVSCGGSSSKEEAIAAVQKLPDFKGIVQTLRISGAFYGWAEVDNADPNLKAQGKASKFWSDHVIIYKTKSGGLRIATISWDRPPTITGLSEEFK